MPEAPQAPSRGRKKRERQMKVDFYLVAGDELGIVNTHYAQLARGSIAFSLVVVPEEYCYAPLPPVSNGY